MPKKEDLDITRLCTAVNRSRLALRKPREERVDCVRELVGAHYSEDGSAKEVPLNLIGMYLNVVGKKLVANNPRVMLSTEVREHKPAVNAMEAWANEEIVRSKMGEVLKRAVNDAIFSIGIVKVSLATPADAAAVSWHLEGGKPFAHHVDLDDFVFDIHARDFQHVSFIGHRFRVPLRVVRDSKLYGPGRKGLEASEDKLYNLEGDERVSVIGRTTLAGSSSDSEFEDMVDLWELYLPRHRLVVTVHDDYLTGANTDEIRYRAGFGKALRIVNWLGPDCGPYHILGLGDVPGNAMPKAPMHDLIDLHRAINRGLRKLIRQMDRLKENTFVQGGASEDGSRVQQSNDGEIIRIDDPSKIAQVVMGVPNQQLFGLVTALKEWFSWLAGNLEIMGGLGPQSRTAHQDELLNQNASATIADMQDKAISWVGGIVEAMCWYWHHDPRRLMETSYAPPGLSEFSVRRRVGPLARQQIPFESLRVQTDPYSLQHQTPLARLQQLQTLVTQIITPLMPLLQQQGIVFDMDAYLQKVGRYMQMPDVPDIISIGEPPAQGGPGQGAPSTSPGSTTRNYVRRSEAGASTKGKDLGIMNQMQPPANNGAQKVGAP